LQTPKNGASKTPAPPVAVMHPWAYGNIGEHTTTYGTDIRKVIVAKWGIGHDRPPPDVAHTKG